MVDLNRKILITLLSLIPVLSIANPIDDNCPDKVFNKAPQIKVEGDNQYICRTGYAVNYNYKTKTAYFSVEQLKSENMRRGVRRNNNFREDKSLPEPFRATLNDYSESSYDRGHLAPAGDFTYSREVMSESFFLSNIIPQNPNNNRGIWNVLEEYTRNLTISHNRLYVITGTIYDSSIVYIGDKVAVPSHLYKIIVDPKTNKSLAFLIPNKDIYIPLTNFIVPLSTLNNLTGIDFFPGNSGIIETTLKDWK